ncbi:MAG: Clp protease N-terminal domain-containing protein [Acidimicrobiales bacterium]
MFERFTADARAVVTAAQHETRRRHDRVIGTQHLLLALLGAPGPVRDVFAAIGIDHERVDAAVEAYQGPRHGAEDLASHADATALAALGIDLDEVRRAVEDTFGAGALTRAALVTPRRRRPRWPRRRRRAGTHPQQRSPAAGHLPFAPRSKKVLELSLREALRLKHNVITAEHIALAILREGEGLACFVLAEAGVDAAGLRGALEEAARARVQPRS